MNEEDKVWRKALRPLSADLPEADAQLERQLLSEFRKQRQTVVEGPRKRVWFRIAFAATGATAAAIVCVFLLRTVPPQKLDLPMAQAPKAPEIAAQIETPLAVKSVASNAKPRTVKTMPKPYAQRQTEPSATEFFDLPYAGPSQPMLRGDVIRVSLPRSAMGIVGLPVNPDRMFEPVQADVIVGDDGVAHAIRFVQYQQPYK